MTTITNTTTPKAHPSPRRWFTPARALRLLIAAVVAALAIGLFAFGFATREAEAWISAHIADLFLSGGATAVTDSIFFRSADGPFHVALQVTEQCASYVVVAPFLLLLAIMLGFTRVGWRRWATVTLVGATALVLVNTLRLLFITFSTRTWGVHPGYELSHGVLGSAFGILGFALVTVIALAMLSPKDRRIISRLRKGSASAARGGSRDVDQ